MELGFVRGYRNKRLDYYSRFGKWMEVHPNLHAAGAVLLMAAVTACLAQVRLYTPLSPVPYTLQVLGISLTGALLGRKLGTISASTYVALGIIGVPVYAGAWHEFEGFRWFSGIDAFTGALGAKSLSMGYIPGFILQAFLVGWIVDRQKQEPGTRGVVAFGAATAAGLVFFVLLDAYVLANYATLYASSPTAFPNAWFLVLCAGLIVLVAGAAWLAFSTKARRERIELLMGNVAGLLALYACGIVGFLLIWNRLDLGPLGTMDLLRYTILPFIPADLSKILLAIGLLTLVRPTRRELEARATEAPPAHV